MKLLEILLGQSSRMIRTYIPGGLYIPDVITPLQERYGFMQVPGGFEDFKSPQGIVCNHGRFLIPESDISKVSTKYFQVGELIIDSLHVLENGVLVSTRGTVESADLFLDDLFDWGANTFGSITVESTPIMKNFFSQIEIQLDSDIMLHLQKADILCDKISSSLSEYGHGSYTFQPYGFSLHFDATQLPAQRLAPNQFIIERKQQMPYKENIFVSSAPLKTTDHLKLLEELEKLAG